MSFLWNSWTLSICWECGSKSNQWIKRYTSYALWLSGNPHGGILLVPVAVPKSVPDFMTTKSPTRNGSVQSLSKHILRSVWSTDWIIPVHSQNKINSVNANHHWHIDRMGMGTECVNWYWYCSYSCLWSQINRFQCNISNMTWGLLKDW